MTTKRAYKLQEFVAHSSVVNCLKIGRKSSRFLLTGGEDHRVNLWSIGKPNAIMSLSGHTTGIDSVTFDSSEILAVAGAASGTIKLWDLEERKLVRTLTGHRSNCITVDFHPFGEFIASGSLDTNLKIWDMRKKGSLDTYKGHLRGITVTRFTPDGRWVVSGGEDHTIKIWDLTAGKLLHDFKCHEGKIQCIDFHPQQFLLATGSADKSLKFLDLQTFQFVGSSGPETSVVNCIKFNPDGKSLLCGLHENLKILSWEPVKCHDTVDVGWSKLGDLNIHEGKLLGCSYNQSCVGIWVADISRLRPYAIGLGMAESGARPISRRMRSGEMIDVSRETLSVERLSVSVPQSSESDARDLKMFPSTGCRTSATTPRMICDSLARSASKRAIGKVSPSPGAVSTSKCDVVPVIVPRADTRSASEHGVESRKEVILVENTNTQSRLSHLRKLSSIRDSPCRPSFSDAPVNALEESKRICNSSDGAESVAAVGRSLDSERSDGNSSRPVLPRVDLVSSIMEHHEPFISSMRSRLCKLNVVRRYWERTDVKGAMSSVETMCDGGVLADLIGVLAKRVDGVNTVDVCCSVLPLLTTSLLDARVERHLGISLEMVAAVVRMFGPLVYSTVSATSSSSSCTGVDIEAEQRSGRCRMCFVELEKIRQCLPHLSRRGGLIGRCVQQLKLAFEEVATSVE